jgi:hypothetical protein
MKTWLMSMLVLLTMPSGLGCSEAKAAFDCQEVCSRYQSCFDSNYDVSACRNRCRDNAKNDSSFESKASTCAACIDDKSCTSAAFNCATDCAGIVP